jgi:hypothetical protein
MENIQKMRTKNRRALTLGMLVAAGTFLPSDGWAQPARSAPASSPSPAVTIEQPDAERTRRELSDLLDRYPPSLREVLGTDPSLLGNQAYLAPYPALVTFLNAHPEIARAPRYYVGEGSRPRPQDRASAVLDLWRDILAGFAALTGVAMVVGLFIWLIRAALDYRRWNRLAKVQTDVHTKLLDRFASNNEILAYIQSPAGSNFLQSSPIKLDPGPRAVAAPLARILWSVQGGVVLIAAGIGLQVISTRVVAEVSQGIQSIGVLAIALGLGFVASAALSYFLSRRLGLIEPASLDARLDTPGGHESGIRE